MTLQNSAATSLVSARHYTSANRLELACRSLSPARLCIWVILSIVLAASPRVLYAVNFGEDVPKEKYPGVGRVLLADEITEKSAHFVSSGTGTLIAPDIVLTAAHVIATAPTPRHIFVKFESQEAAIPCIAYRAHPGYIGSNRRNLSSMEQEWLKTSTFWDSAAADVAVLKLDRPLTGIEMYPMSADFPPPQTLLTLVGCGQTADKTSDGKRRSGVLKVVRTYKNMLLVMPGSEKNQMIDHGDSGGPVLVENNNHLEIAATVQGWPNTRARLSGLTSDEWAAITAAPYTKSWVDAMIVDLKNVQFVKGRPMAYIRRMLPNTPQLATSMRQLIAMDQVGLSNQSVVERVFLRGINDPLPLELCQNLKKSYRTPDDWFFPPLPMPTGTNPPQK